MKQFQNAIERPEGIFFFGGEHCSNDQAWLQGAIASALQAVKD